MNTGSSDPSDDLIDCRSETVTIGVIEMAVRIDNDSTSFDFAAEHLARTAQVAISGERLRKLAIVAKTAVPVGQRNGIIPTAFQASDCTAGPTQPSGPTCIYARIDGVMVLAITDAHPQSTDGVATRFAAGLLPLGG